MKRYRIQLTEGEKFVIAIDDHWVSIMGPIALMLLGFVFAVSFFFLAHYFMPLHIFLSHVLYVFAMAVAMLSAHWFFIYLFEWELSTWIVTTQRIMSIRFLPYVRHDVSYTMIQEIHEIEKHKHGLWKNLLNYGDVEINLAAVPHPTTYRYVPKPSAFTNLIQTIHKASNPDKLSIEDLRRMYLM